jgi:septal ring factor EnvC (AmiA/AmiB activator)
MKMVKSMAAAGMSGPLLYQTAFNAFSAVNGGTVPNLLASASQFEQVLATDRDKVLARHREKMGETTAPGAAPSTVVQLTAQEKKLAAELAELTRQLQAKQQQLVQTQQQLAEERQKTQAALASYELANSAALAELQAHRKAAESFLNATGPASK